MIICIKIKIPERAVAHQHCPPTGNDLTALTCHPVPVLNRVRPRSLTTPADCGAEWSGPEARPTRWSAERESRSGTSPGTRPSTSLFPPLAGHCNGRVSSAPNHGRFLPDPPFRPCPVQSRSTQIDGSSLAHTVFHVHHYLNRTLN